VNAAWGRLALAAALAGLLAATGHKVAPARPQIFEIKGKSIVVPPPAGMASVLGIDKRLDDFQRATVLERNELHACFVPDSEVAEYRRSTAQAARGADPEAPHADAGTAGPGQPERLGGSRKAHRTRSRDCGADGHRPQ